MESRMRLIAARTVREEDSGLTKGRFSTFIANDRSP